MKFILIATVFGTMQPVYDNQDTCNMAAKVINESYPLEQALCIPMPETTYKSTQQDRLFTNFVEMIEKIVELENKNKTVVDKQ